MELTNNNDVLIVLNITDRRGRNIRVAAVKDIKVKVWTRDPECALTFNYRDIIQKSDCDVISIPSRQMSALPSGIVVYQYIYKGGLPDEPHGHCTYLPNIERCHTVTTDIFWKNCHFEDFMKNPTFYNSLEHLKDLIELESKERHHQFGDLYHYVTETYTNNLQDEIDRAKGREDEIEANINNVSEKLDAEIKRSTEVDIHFLEVINELDGKTQGDKDELDGNIKDENKRAEEAEKELQGNIEAETERAKAEEKRLEEKIDAEIARSKAEDVQTNLVIETEVTRAKQEEARIEARMEAEKSRAMNAEKRLQNDLDDEVKRAKETEKELEQNHKELKKDFEEEVERAKKAENDIKLQVETVKGNVEVLDSNHKAELARIEGKVDAETARAIENEKHIQSDIDDEIARAKSKETEIETLIKNHIAESDDTYKNVSEKLDAEISRATIKENELSAAIEAETNRAKTEEGRIEGKVDVNADNIVSETNRAKLVEHDITEALQALKTASSAKDTELSETIDGLRSELYAEIQRSESEDADINKALGILNGDEDTIGSVLHSIKDAEHRINDNLEDLRDEVEEIIGGNLEDYATKVYVDERFTKLIGEAPEAYDTLEEIANKLKQDDNVFAAIQEILTGKAEKEDVYTKAEIDRKEADLSNAVQTEVQRATLAENGLQSQVDATKTDVAALTEKVNSHIAEGDSYYQELNRAIIEETTRATNAETQLQNNIDVINGDENTIGSINHAVSDLGHEVDDKLAALKLETSETLKDYAKQADLTNLTDTVTAHISDADAKYAELNNAIVSEVTRATNAETINANAIAVINGDENTIGSINHAVQDANHYTDDEIAKIKDLHKEIESNLNSHIEEATEKFEDLTIKEQELRARIEELEEIVSWEVYD